MPFVGNVTKIALCVITLSVAACSSGDGALDEPTAVDPANGRTLANAPLPSTQESRGSGTRAGTVVPAPTSSDAPASEPPATDPPASDPPASDPPPAGSTPPPVTTTPPPAAKTSLRGTNLVGMEGGYSFSQTNGPVPDTDYPVHSNQIVDYLAAKHVNVVRFLFSWERMQSTLGGPVPAASSGNYKTYFDNYKRIVDYATSQGMTVIVAPWQADSGGGAGGARWRGNQVGAGTVTSAHFADFWSKMATIFAANPRVVINLVNEPNSMSTMTWFSIAQSAVTAIRGAGFTGEIHIPGNGWTGAGSWNDSWYDTGSPQRSNAYGWLNARGPGLPLSDPLGKSIVEVHAYADSDAAGSTTGIVSSTISRTRVKVVTDWARASGLHVFVGEIGMYASASNGTANWNDFVSFAGSNGDTLSGFAWWGCGKPGWWNDVAANNGGHFSITPTNDYTTDTVNMTMIKSAFVQ